MQEKDITKLIRDKLEEIKGKETADAYYYGFRDGTNWLFFKIRKELVE